MQKVATIVWACGALCLLTTALEAQIPALEEIQAALEKPILEPGQPLIEMRAFLEPRIPVFTWPTDSDVIKIAAELAELRKRVLNEIVFRGPRAAQWRTAQTKVEWLDAIQTPHGYSIQKLRYEVIPGMWVPALLYLPDGGEEPKRPAVLNLGGHESEGMVKDYKQIRCINLAKRGFAALNVEWFGMGQLRTPGFNHYKMNQIDLCGESGFAVFYLAMTRALDLLAAHERVDANRIAVTGLSGGGLQTIYLAALDTRVAAANPVAGYGSLRSAVAYDDLGDSEHVPSDLATLADFTHLTAMVDPRPLLLTYNATDDCCFQAAHSLPALLAATAAVSETVDVHINADPGTHNYDRENREAFYRFVGRELRARGEPPAQSGMDWREIPSDNEVLPAEALAVPLPADNLDLNKMALSLAEGLPRVRIPVSDKAALESWRREARKRLAQTLPLQPPCGADQRSVPPDPTPRIGWTEFGFVERCHAHWSVPITEIGHLKNAQSVVYLLADAGRKTLAERALREHLAGRDAVAFDPLGVGESQITGSDPWYLHSLHVAVVGQRPLAIQAQQIQRVTSYARSGSKSQSLHAYGPRMSVAALVAAALGPPSQLDEVHLWQCPASLKQLIENNVGADETPELFAFGLLAEFDILELAALAAPRRVVFHEPTERHRQELGPLAKLYQTLGIDHNPLDERGE